MKKLFAAVLVTVASSFAFASDLSLANLNKPQKVDAVYTAPTAKVAAPAEIKDVVAAEPASPVEQAAGKLGSLLGGLVKHATNAGKAFGNGVTQAMGKPADASPAPASQGRHAQPSVSPEGLQAAQAAQQQMNQGAVPAILANSPLGLLSAMVKRAKEEQSAPVEERSAVASSSDY